MSDSKLFQDATRYLQNGQALQAVALLHSQLEQTPDDETCLSILGSALMRLGKPTEALARFTQAVIAHPTSYAAHADLGFACMKLQDRKGAVGAFEKATALNQEFYPAWCFLAKLYFDGGQFDHSLTAYSRSLACDPFTEQFAKIQSAIAASRLAEGEEIARGILAKQQGHPKAAHALAHLATTVGAHEDSIRILEHGLSYHPCDRNLRTALINSLEKVGAYEAAMSAAEVMTRLFPKNQTSWHVLGRMHSHCGAYEKALAAHDTALTCMPLSDFERGNLELLRGHILRTTNQEEDCIEAYRNSIFLAPDNGAGWWGLANLKTYKFSLEDREVLASLAQNGEIELEQRSQAAFALGKACEGEKDYGKAFVWYQMANDLKPDVSFIPDEFEAVCRELRTVYSAALLTRQAAPPPTGPTPIFIVGLPRAGSTLIEQILASHSQIEGTMELQNLPNLLRRIIIEGGKRKTGYPQSMAGFSRVELSAFGQTYLDETALYRTGKPYFIDKLPPNFEHVGLLHMILPQAIIIDARRHPMDGGFSCYKQHFAAGHEFSYDLDTIGHYFNSYLALMDHWDRVLPGKVKCVHYEDMVADTAAEITGLLTHVGLEVEPACFEFYKNKRAVRTASSQQVRQPIYRNSVGVWRHMEPQLAPLKEALGDATLNRLSHWV